ncbi:E3 ubiquitin-protein ligase TRIM56-like [Apostichopus japonicus]|uniref:E3 ubiquitin-protein ligase TRIM56-like n=1 Tax=Stichopus japonicus TaxID=307972 RepID=UPI003AB271D2
MDLAISFKDLSENFFRCTVCLDQFKNPELLPCLHRYCRDCLSTVIHASHDKKFNCPMCIKDYIIPEYEVDDFKTDFHMKSMLEFQKLQKSFGTEDLQKCVSCSDDSQVFAYCWKCTDFLCNQCYKAHISNKMFADHRTHTRKLENIDAKNLTLDKIPTLLVPNCHFHDDKEAILCCKTCRNLPVCVVCIYSKHKSHDIHDVTELANSERELLTPKLAEIDQQKGKIYEVRMKVHDVSIKLSENVSKKTLQVEDHHKLETHKINGLLSELTNMRGKQLKEIETRKRDEFCEINIKLEDELSQVRKKYDEIKKKNANTKYDVETKHVNEKSDKRESALSKKHGKLDAEFKKLMSTKNLIAQSND